MQKTKRQRITEYCTDRHVTAKEIAQAVDTSSSALWVEVKEMIEMGHSFDIINDKRPYLIKYLGGPGFVASKYVEEVRIVLESDQPRERWLSGEIRGVVGLQPKQLDYAIRKLRDSGMNITSKRESCGMTSYLLVD